MEIRALRVFVEVVRQGGFTRAANTVYATQSTVSKTVKNLEDELGLQLLERIGHRIRLTAAGEVVYRRAITILAQGEELRAELEDLRGVKGGTLRLGVPPIGSNLLFAKWFAEYRRVHPGVDIQLVEYGAKHLEELVLAGELDLGVSLLPVSGEFEWKEVRREPIDVLLPAGHPLANRKKLAFEALADEPFVLYGPGFALNPIILEACRENGFEPKVTAQSSQIDFIIELVAVKLGVAFLPRVIAEQRPHPMVRRIAVDHPAVFWHMALIWRRGVYLSHAAQAWLAMAGAGAP